MQPKQQITINVYDMFMGVIGVISLGLISFRFTLNDSDEVARLVDWFDTAICGFFLFDFFRNCARATDLKHYLFTWGILDLVSAIPVSNSFRWARIARLIRIFRLIKSLSLIVRAIRHERRSALLIGTIAVAALTLAICSIGVLHFEKGAPDSSLRTASDAIWWSTVTLTSVGYGDHVPVTAAGRLLAGWLMITGVVMVGAFAGIFADALRVASGVSSQQANSQRPVINELEILKSLIELRAELNTLTDSLKQTENRSSQADATTRINSNCQR